MAAEIIAATHATSGRNRVTMLSALVIALALLSGCSSVDPTDPSNFNDVSVRNDEGAAVVLIQCDTTCAVLHDRTTLKAGAATTLRVSNEDITVGYVVESSSGTTLGCLYFRYDGPQQGVKVAVSAMVACRQ